MITARQHERGMRRLNVSREYPPLSRRSGTAAGAGDGSNLAATLMRILLDELTEAYSELNRT